MTGKTQAQREDDLQAQIFRAKADRVNQRILDVLTEENMAIQCYMHYGDGAVIPMVRLVERKPEPPQEIAKTSQ